MSSASNYGSNRESIIDQLALVNGTVRKIVQVAGLSDVVLNWINFAANGVATIKIYASLFDDPRTNLKDLNPATNPRWTDQTPFGAVFPTLPAGAIGSDMLPLTPNPGFHHLLVELVVTAPFDKFSIVVRGQGRSG